MKYDRIVANDDLNAAINLALMMLSPRDAKAYRKTFAALSHSKDQLNHTFRELFCGTFFGFFAWTVERDRKIEDKTPDWTVMRNGSPACLIEVVTFHASRATNADGTQRDHVLRLYQRLQEKFTKYRGLILTHAIAYVPCLFLDSDAAVQMDDVKTCLLSADSGLFADHPYVSGVQVLTDAAFKYRFTYIPNPTVMHPYMLPSGDLVYYMSLCNLYIDSTHQST